MDKDLELALAKSLKSTAKSLRIPDGSASEFISLTIKAVSKSLAQKSIITKSDLTRIVTKELRKYNADFAYVYQIRDIII